MKILHQTFHNGCAETINFVMKSLGHDITTQFANWNYNIGHDRAEEIWNKYKDYYNSFDVIITSDTAPLCRIFLQNNYKGKLLIWVCNRVTYADEATNDCKFPDQKYLDLIKSIPSRPNVKIFSYTKFEYEYAKKYKNIDLGTEVIKPCCSIEESIITSFPPELNKSDTFFIPPYHNDTIFMNLKEKCDSLEIASYAGRYHGAGDLQGIKGIIHIPYGWSNLALFENWDLGNVYFVPSKEFLLKLSKQNNFWWQDSYALDLIDSSEWYLPEHKDLFMYFDSWEQLKELTKDNKTLNAKKKKISAFAKKHTTKTLEQWKKVLA